MKWRVYIGLFLLLAAFGGIGYLYQQRVTEKREAERQFREWVQIQAERDAERLRQHNANIQAQKNANYGNMTAAEIEQQLIREVRGK